MSAELNSFVDLHQMRRGIEAGAKARRPEHRFQHGCGRALPVRARDQDVGAGVLRPPQIFQQFGNIFEPQLVDVVGNRSTNLITERN